jgi:hypothetical protein
VILRGHTASIAERMQADLAAFMKLPPAPYDACDKVNVRVSSLSLVRYKNNDYFQERWISTEISLLPRSSL